MFPLLVFLVIVKFISLLCLIVFLSCQESLKDGRNHDMVKDHPVAGRWMAHYHQMIQHRHPNIDLIQIKDFLMKEAICYDVIPQRTLSHLMDNNFQEVMLHLFPDLHHDTLQIMKVIQNRPRAVCVRLGERVWLQEKICSALQDRFLSHHL